jgi:hypothetical protein
MAGGSSRPLFLGDSMTQPSTTAAETARTPPLAKDLDAVQVRYTWKVGEGGGPPTTNGAEARPEPGADPAAPAEEEDAVALLNAQIRHYTAALEDIVTLALSNADYKERAIMMHRRAVAALSSTRK